MKESIQSEKQERMRIRRILKQQSVSETLVTPGYQTHEHLCQIATKLPTDFEPYGQVKRATISDCSSGCRWLAGRLGQDWGGHSPYTKGNFEFERVLRGWRTSYPVLDLRLKR
jgi:hypothetical protein